MRLRPTALSEPRCMGELIALPRLLAGFKGACLRRKLNSGVKRREGRLKEESEMQNRGRERTAGRARWGGEGMRRGEGKRGKQKREGRRDGKRRSWTSPHCKACNGANGRWAPMVPWCVGPIFARNRKWNAPVPPTQTEEYAVPDFLTDSSTCCTSADPTSRSPGTAPSNNVQHANKWIFFHRIQAKLHRVPQKRIV